MGCANLLTWQDIESPEWQQSPGDYYLGGINLGDKSC